MNALAFLKLGYPLARQHRTVDEDILAAGHGDETETLLRVVPFDLPVDLFRRTGRTIEAAVPRRAVYAKLWEEVKAS